MFTFTKVVTDATLPTGNNPYTLFACEPKTVPVGGSATVRTGLKAIHIPEGMRLHVRTPWCTFFEIEEYDILPGNEMEICVRIHNPSMHELVIFRGTRIATAFLS